MSELLRLAVTQTCRVHLQLRFDGRDHTAPGSSKALTYGALESHDYLVTGRLVHNRHLAVLTSFPALLGHHFEGEFAVATVVVLGRHDDCEDDVPP